MYQCLTLSPIVHGRHVCSWAPSTAMVPAAEHEESSHCNSPKPLYVRYVQDEQSALCTYIRTLPITPANQPQLLTTAPHGPSNSHIQHGACSLCAPRPLPSLLQSGLAVVVAQAQPTPGGRVAVCVCCLVPLLSSAVPRRHPPRHRRVREREGARRAAGWVTEESTLLLLSLLGRPPARPHGEQQHVCTVSACCMADNGERSWLWAHVTEWRGA